MYLNQTLIKIAIEELSNVHGFYGISFLTCKKANLPISNKIEISINQLEEDFLREYYAVDPRSEFFYRAFRISDANKFWIRPDYAWKGSHRVRTGTFGRAFIHEKGTDVWGWCEDYVDILEDKLHRKQPIPAFALAVWLFRERNWLPETSHSDVIEQFFREFDMTLEEQNRLFNTAIPESYKNDPLLDNDLFAWDKLSESLDIPLPPDVPQNESGRLSRLSLNGIGPANKLELTFAERLNLLTGDNGLGKSFILECAWWALSGNWTNFPAFPREGTKGTDPRIIYEMVSQRGKRYKGQSVYDWEQQDWPPPEELPPTVPGLLIYARVDGGISVWDPLRNNSEQLLHTGVSRSLVFTREEVWDGRRAPLGGRTVSVLNGLIADWIDWQTTPDKAPFSTLKKILRRLSPPSLDYGDLGFLEPGKPTRISHEDRRIPTIRHSYGEVPIVFASAGVQRIVALAYVILWAWEQHKRLASRVGLEPQRRMVILLDELESHLHPQWQRTILPAILDIQLELSAEIELQLIAATHSPLVMASVEPLFEIEKDKIFHIDLIRNGLLESEVEIENIEFVKQGSVDSWLKSEIFELSQARSIEAEKTLEDAKNIMGQKDVTPEQIEEVSQRLMNYLPTHGDGFWPRWTFFAEQHGVDL